MAGPKQSSYEQVGIYKETVRGTSPIEKLHVMPLYDRGFDLFEDTPADVNEITGSPVPGEPGRGVLRAEGTVTVPFDHVGIGLWWYVLLSSYGKAGVGDPYTHTFKVGATDPVSFGIELGNNGVPLFDVIPGCAVRGLNLTAEKTPAKATAQVDLIGCIAGPPDLKNGTSVDAAPSLYTTQRYNLFPTICKINGTASAYAQRVAFNIRREVAVEHVLDGLRYPAYVSFGGFTISGEVTAIWDDADAMRELCMTSAGLAAAENKIELDFFTEDVNHDMKIYADEVQYFLGAAPGIGGRGARKLTIGFKAYYGNDADAPIKVELRNATADYPAIFTVG